MMLRHYSGQLLFYSAKLPELSDTSSCLFKPSKLLCPSYSNLVVLKIFWSQDSFTLLKIEDPKEILCIYRSYLLVFIILKLTGKFQTYFQCISYLKITMSLLYVNINNIFYEKELYFLSLKKC